MLVVAERGTDEADRRRRDEGGVAEIVVLVLALHRPVRGEHVFEAGADGITVPAVAGGRERDRDAGDRDAEAGIGEGVAALHVEQAGTPGPAEPPGNRAET